MSRSNGRTPKETREITIRYEQLARVDGSCRFSFGENAALASVSGPIEVRLAAEQPSKATFEVTVLPLANIPSTSAKATAADLRSCLSPSLILTKYPRTLIQLVVQDLTTAQASISNDSTYASMINAATLAFLNAGSIPMTGVIIAAAVGRLDSNLLVVDPDAAEAKSATSIGCFAFRFDETTKSEETSDCVWSNWRSNTTSKGYTQTDILEARKLAFVGATALYNKIREGLQRTNFPRDRTIAHPGEGLDDMEV